jgi:LPXTG-motif cell wall-anchored protein
LTDEEKQAAKDQIDSDAKKAQEAIDNAATDDAVNTAVDNGKLAIDKDIANAAIDNAVAGKREEIANSPLTAEEKTALNSEVTDAANKAKNAIDSATTIPAVEDAKNTGVATINDIAVPATSLTKDQANQTIDGALANKTKEINDATNLSDKQKQDLIDQANQEAATAKDNIKNATSNEAVNKATTDGVEAIANVSVPSLDDAKKDASQVIDDVLKQKEDEINNASHLTDQEKQDLINQVQNVADEAKDKINQATTNDDVATERDAGAEKIANIVVPSLDDAKDKASKAIDDALADKTKEINDQTNLSDQEKNDLINQITDIADKAKDKINNAATDADIAKNEKDGIDAIVDTKIPGLEDHKKNAINSLDEAKSTKLAQIDGATHLTANEKTNLTQQVDAEYDKALDEINKAITNDDADKASADGVEAILNIKVPSFNEKKQDSVDALNEVRDAKKDKINKATNLNQNEKDELNKQVDQIADKAINAINEANDDQTAKNAENKGIQDILDVKVPSLDEVKNNAKQAIVDALESKQNEINKAVNLDQSTKQDLINQAKTAAENANKNIDLATTNDEVIAASKKGVQNIENIIVPAPSTNSDTSNINTDQTDSDANKTSNNDINKNTDNPKHSKSGKSSVSLDDKKNQAINELTKVAEAKKAAINSTNISADAKARLNAQVDRELARGKNSISQARNSEELTSSKNTAIAAINSISVAPKGTQGVNSRENHGNTDLNNNSITVSERPISHIPTSDKQETLPQTGHHANEGLTILGTLVAGVAGLITLAGTKKRKD